MSADTAWLAGFWDADGTIGIYKRTTYFVPAASVTNTNPLLVAKVKGILDAQDIKYCVEYRDRGDNRKPAWTIRVESKPRVSKLLNYIREYLIGKQGQADLVLEWCKRPGRRRNLTARDHEIRNNVTELNIRGTGRVR